VDFEAIVRANSQLAKIQDIDILLEQILLMAREVVNADAGSIYVKRTAITGGRDDDRLFIKYAQNDTLQKSLPPGQKQVYSRFSLPIDEKSIAGYCGLTRTIINLPDTHRIPQGSPYSFNSSFDTITGYKTVSTLTFPLVHEDNLLGVIQVINKTAGDGSVVAFSREDEFALTNFAESATAAMQRANVTRALIMRLVKMAELRDPTETGAHVDRVSNFAVEIYDRWSYLNNVSEDEKANFRDVLKIGAMLHDVGKVAISDLILKKPGRFTDAEYVTMKEHTLHGARLFGDSFSLVDSVSKDVAFTHHENWDGSGYPGWVNPFTGAPTKSDAEGRPIGRKGAEIPISGRIVAIADVFDALSSRRAYKEAWTEEEVLNEIRKLSGTKFDPDLVDIFFEILPIIKNIQDMYSA